MALHPIFFLGIIAIALVVECYFRFKQNPIGKLTGWKPEKGDELR